jgi:hypothetical protein
MAKTKKRATRRIAAPARKTLHLTASEIRLVNTAKGLPAHEIAALSPISDTTRDVTYDEAKDVPLAKTVQDCISRLTDTIYSNRIYIDEVEKKLAPVLSPMGPSRCTEDINEVVPLVHVIENLIQHVKDSNAHLRAIVANIAL